MRGFRNFGRSEDDGRLPRRTEQGQQPTVQAKPACILPCDHNENRERKEQRIDARAAGHHKVPIQEPAEERGDAGKGAQEQQYARSFIPPILQAPSSSRVPSAMRADAKTAAVNGQPFSVREEG